MGSEVEAWADSNIPETFFKTLECQAGSKMAKSGKASEVRIAAAQRRCRKEAERRRARDAAIQAMLSTMVVFTEQEKSRLSNRPGLWMGFTFRSPFGFC
jgi:hypothetical protein